MMDSSEIKKLMMDSLDAGTETSEIPSMLEKQGIRHEFSRDFGSSVLDKIFSPGVVRMSRQAEFVKYMNSAFYRVALTGVAAIIILLISIFMMEGSISFNSFLGLSENYDESIVLLLTGN